MRPIIGDIRRNETVYEEAKLKLEEALKSTGYPLGRNAWGVEPDPEGIWRREGFVCILGNYLVGHAANRLMAEDRRDTLLRLLGVSCWWLFGVMEGWDGTLPVLDALDGYTFGTEMAGYTFGTEMAGYTFGTEMARKYLIPVPASSP